MKIVISFFAFGILLLAACGTPQNSGTVVDPRYDPDNPAVQSAPVPATQAPSPTDPTPRSAPATYGTVATPKGVATPSTYGSASMSADMVAAPLVGAWTNQSDPDENIVFTDHSYTSYYDGEMIVEEEMTYHARCPASCSGGQVRQVPCFIITSEFGTDCYGIIRVGPAELELSVLGQGTETVTYVRSNP